MNGQNELYEFRLILSGFSELTEEVMDSLFEAGCDDGLLCLDRNGTPFIDFERVGTSLRGAIMSAIADVEKTGFRVERVEMDAIATIDSINSNLLSRT